MTRVSVVKQRACFPGATAQQRELLVQGLGVNRQCGHSEREGARFTPDFLQLATTYAALEHFESSAPHQPQCTPVEIEQEVSSLRCEHPEWGKKVLPLR